MICGRIRQLVHDLPKGVKLQITGRNLATIRPKLGRGTTRSNTLKQMPVADFAGSISWNVLKA